MVQFGDTMHCLVDMGTNYGTVWRYNALSGGHGYELWYPRTMVRCGDTMHCLVDMGTNYGTVWQYNVNCQVDT